MPHIFEVGGKVRDELLGIQSKDVDFCFVLPPNEAQGLSAEAGFGFMRQWILGQGETIFKESSENFTIRAKGRSGKAGHDYVLAIRKEDEDVKLGTLTDDLLARDFTINAIAKASDGTLIDPSGGIEDLHKGRLRCPISPTLVFQHDPVRAIRAVRFSVKLGVEWSAELETALHDPILVEWMQVVKDDRVLQELTKAFQVDSWKVLKRLHSLPKALVANWLQRPGFWLMPTTRNK